MQEARVYMQSQRTRKQYQSDLACVLAGLQEPLNQVISSEELDRLVTQYATQREERTNKFVNHVRRQRAEFMDRLWPDS